MSNSKRNYYYWLTNEDYGEECKRILSELYNEYFYCKDKNEKQELFKQIEIYLSVVCDVIAYRYLVKHYIELFYKLSITIEEYMDYKVKRLLATFRDKKEHIEDVISYIYMSFMLSSPRLIYDFAEKIGRCKLVKTTLPYYQTARNNFFRVKKDVEHTEHYIYNVETLFLDEEGKNKELIHSNLDNYSYTNWEKEEQLKYNGVEEYQQILKLIEKLDYSKNSKDYIKYIFINWKDKIESDYQDVSVNFGDTYNLVDYIRYNYENNRLSLSYNDYIDVLKILNAIIKK